MSYVLNPALTSGLSMLDPYGNRQTLMVLKAPNPTHDVTFVHYVQGDMYEPGDVRQFIIIAPTQIGAIEAYDVQLQREHKLAGRKHFEVLVRIDDADPGKYWGYRKGMTFAQWWAAQPCGGRWFAGRNFTPDVCLQLTA